MNARSKIIHFPAGRAAELIDSKGTADALAVMKAHWQSAADVAAEWANAGDQTKPWPLAEPGARGEMLVDALTNDVCQKAHEAALRVAGQCGQARAAATAPWHQMLIKRWASGKNFASHQMHRDELARWVEAVGIVSEYDFAAPQAAPVANECTTNSPDFAMLATREKLIEAFGRFTNMNMSWFDNLKDTPALQAARKVVGQGGRGHIAEPLFCPVEVLQWLINPKRRKGSKLGPEKGWELLEKHFPIVYAQCSIADPRGPD